MVVQISEVEEEIVLSSHKNSQSSASGIFV